MAETAPKTTNPRRRAARSTTTAKPATAKPAARKPAPKKTTETSFTFELAPSGETKNYSLFDTKTDAAGNETKCGFSKFYAPLGTTSVSITITGPADVVEEVVESVEE